MNKDRRMIFGTMLVDVVKYLLTVIVIGSVFAETIKIKQMIVGLCLATVIAYVAYKLIPSDRKE